MTPKEKANSLIEQIKPFAEWGPGDLEMELQNAVKCALITVKEILQNNLNSEVYYYWEEVEEELFIISNKNK
jgi:hypothetical protein